MWKKSYNGEMQILLYFRLSVFTCIFTVNFSQESEIQNVWFYVISDEANLKMFEITKTVKRPAEDRS